MTAEKFKRKLAAILSADVKGYSRLMGEDEESTLRTLQEYKEVMASSIQHHRGRIVGTAGDSVLVEFASVVDAVQCGVEIQQVLRAKNALLPEDRRMDFRIGINLGDVIEEGDTIYGDGVNIAARLDGLAEAGRICISESAYQQIENKLPLRYDYLGEHEVKNIAKPVRVYCARIEADAAPSKLGKEKKPVGKRLSKVALAIVAVVVIAGAVILYQFVLRPSPSKTEVASKEKMAFPLPDKPSIAILPFVNMSGDPTKDYLSDGLTEDVINAFSKTSQIFVIARNSTFTYKGKSVKIQKVAEEMGVRYVLEGSVQWSGERVRITAQLIDALKGHHLFSERYDRDLKDLFAVQDDVTMKILTALRVKLTEGEAARALAKGTKNLEAYLKILQSYEQRQIISKEAQARARQLAEEAIALDPRYALAYSSLAAALGNEVIFGSYKNPREVLERAYKLAEKAVSLDDSLAYSHQALGFISILYQKDYDKAIAEAERAVALEPNSAEAYGLLAQHLTWAGRPDEAILFFKKALRFSPIPNPRWLFTMAGAYRMVGRYEESIAMCKKILEKQPDHLFAHTNLLAAYMLSGREDEARAEAAEVLRIDPNFSVERFAKSIPTKNQAETDRYIGALRKAGLK